MTVKGNQVFTTGNDHLIIPYGDLPDTGYFCRSQQFVGIQIITQQLIIGCYKKTITIDNEVRCKTCTVHREKFCVGVGVRIDAAHRNGFDDFARQIIRIPFIEDQDLM